MESSKENPNGVRQGESLEKQSKDIVTHSMNDSGMQMSQNRKGTRPFVMPQISSREPGNGAHISQLDVEGRISSIMPKGVPRTPGSVSHVLQAGYEVKTPLTLEKMSEDGYNWQKYGQKLVKGNEFVRSYYRCTQLGCQVKKQLEHSHDGKIADVVYLGKHDHPETQHSVPAGSILSKDDRKSKESSLTGVEGEVPKAENEELPPKKSVSTSLISTVTSTEDVKSVLPELSTIRDVADNDEGPQLKRLKKSNSSTDYKHVDNFSGKQRLVVQTESAVDFVNDGYRWRKYGQKNVKDNTNPRSYYRCSSPRCGAKKQVERSSLDPKLVTTTYEGQHDHVMPNSRTGMHSANGLNGTQNCESYSDSGASHVMPLDKVVNKLSNREGKSQEQINWELKMRTEESGATKLDATIHSCSAPQCKSNEQKNGKSSAMEENDVMSLRKPTQQQNGKSSTMEDIGATSLDKTLAAASFPKGRPNNVHGRSRTEPKEQGTAYTSQPINLGTENKPKEQYASNSEAVKSN